MNSANHSKEALRGLLSLGVIATALASATLASPALAQTPPQPSLHHLRHEVVRARHEQLVQNHQLVLAHQARDEEHLEHRADREQHHQLVLAHQEHSEHHEAVVAHVERRRQHYAGEIRHQGVLARHDADRLKHEKPY